MSQNTKWSKEDIARARARMAGRSCSASRRTSDVQPSPAPRESRNKYGVRKAVVAGVVYDSGAEAAQALELEARIAAGELDSYRRQIPLAVVRAPDGRIWFGEIVTKCTVDFEVRYADGRLEYVEVKGYRVRDWPVRERAMRAAGVPLRVVSTSRKRKGVRNSKTTG